MAASRPDWPLSWTVPRKVHTFLRDMAPQNVGRRLRDLRLAAGLTQEDLAPLAGVRARTISRWETGTTAGLYDDATFTSEFDLAQVAAAIDLIAWWRQRHVRPLATVNANLRHYVRAYGPVPVTQRLKRTPTIVDKLVREPTMQLTTMGDIGGVRAILPSLGAIADVSRQLRRNWTIPRTRDYIAEPKASGYRAVHHQIRRNGYLIELQLRTPRQDLWANVVEDDARDTGIALKSGDGPGLVHEYYVAVSDLFALQDLGSGDDEEAKERVQAAYAAARPHLATLKED